MPNYKKHMRETITYWPPVGDNEFGDTLYGPPESRKCRWQDVAVLFRSNEGREEISSAVVYLSAPVENKGMLFRGVSEELTPVDGAKEIRQVGDSPNLKQSLSLVKVFL